MKKFLTHKATMIGSIVAAAVVLVLLIVLCARPVSVGYTYTEKGKELGVEYTVKYHFDSSKKVTVKATQTASGVETKEEEQHYYVERDGYVFLMDAEAKDVKDADFKTWKKNITELKDDQFKAYAELRGIKVSAFKLGEGDDVAKCGGAVATVVVLAVVDVALAGLAVTSVLLSKKK